MKLNTPRTARFAAAAALAVTSLAMGACGSQDKDSASAEASDCDTAGAEEAVTTALNEAKTKNPYPTDPVDGKGASGKSFWIIPITTAVTAVAKQVDGFKAAATAVGAEATVFDAKGSPTTAAQGIENAIAAKASAIVLLYVPPAVVSQAVTAAADANIPIVEGFNGQLDAPMDPGVVGRSTPDSIALGKLAGAYAIYNQGCDAYPLAVGSASETLASRAYVEGARDEVGNFCPSCSFEEIDVKVADVTTKLLGEVQSTLRTNADINVILSASYTPYGTYITQALNALDSDVRVVSKDAVINDGKDDRLVGDIMTPPSVVIGWYLFDAALRGEAGQTDFATEMPISLFDETNWGDTNDPFELLPQFDGYEQSFTELWGVSS